MSGAARRGGRRSQGAPRAAAAWGGRRRRRGEGSRRAPAHPGAGTERGGAAPRHRCGRAVLCGAVRCGAGAERPPPGGGCAGRRGRAARGKRAANATWAPPERPERRGEERRGLAGSEAGRARGDGTGASEGLGLGSASGSRLGSLRPARGCPGEKLRDRRLPPRGSVLRLEQPLAPLLRSLPAPLGHSRAPGAARRGGGRPSVPVRGAAGRAALPSAPGCRCLPAPGRPPRRAAGCPQRPSARGGPGVRGSPGWGRPRCPPPSRRGGRSAQGPRTGLAPPGGLRGQPGAGSGAPASA